MKKYPFSNAGIMLSLVLVFVISTASYAQTTVFSENFDGGSLQVTPSGVPAWSLNSSLQVSSPNSYHNVVALNDSSMFITDVINLTGYNYVLLDFQHICKIEFFDAAEIFISIDNGTNWTKLTQNEYLGVAQFGTNGDKFTATSYPLLWLPAQHGEPPTNAWWMFEQFNISAIAGNQSQVRLKFKLRDGNSNGSNTNAGWFLDDIKVIASPYELIPPTITLIPPVLQDTVYSAGPFIVGATITDASGIHQADLIFRIDSTVWDTIPMINVGGNDYEGEIPGQPYNTVIDYYVRAIDASLSYNEAQTTVRTFINKKPPPVVIVGTGTVTHYYAPCYGYYNYGWSGSLYTAPEINANGVIDSIGFYINNSVTAFLMINQSMYLGHRTYTFYDASMNTMPDVMLYTQIFTGNVTWTGPGWYMFKLSTPFIYNGTQTLEVVWTNYDGSYTSGYPTFASTTMSQNMTKYNYADPAMPTGPGTLVTNRPNLRLVFMPNDNDYDAGVVEFTEPPAVVLTSNPYDVKVRIKNYGIQTLTDFDVEWEVNGTPQTTFFWTGTLLEDVVSAPITIGSSSFVLGNNTLRAWTVDPNGFLDENPLNDTLTVNIFGCDQILNGNYTINPGLPTSGTNFNSFLDAMTALSNCGVDGPVVFNVAAGTYNTRLVFNGAFPGVSAVNTITFRGAPGTIIQHTTTVSDQRAAILLNGAKHLRFDSLTVNIPAASTFGVGFQLISQAENIQITNCTVNVNASSTSSNYYGIVASGSMISPTTTGNSAHNILIQNNTINGGYYGIVLFGETANPLANVQIVGNTVNTPYYYGIRTGYTNAVQIEANTITPRVSGGTVSSYGIYMAYEYGAYKIIRNKIDNFGTYGIYITNATPASGRALLANNSIGGSVSTSVPYGIYLTTCSNIDIIYNSVNVNTGTARGLYTISSATGLRVLNNSFSFTGAGAGYAVYHSVTSSLIEHNYNNYYSTGTAFVYYGSAVSNLAALQAINIPAGNDQNSVSADPVYASNTNLYPLGGVLNNAATPVATVSNDILGLARDPVNPDIGAYEYTPVAGDIELTSVELIHGECITNNDSLYFAVKNILGSIVDFSVDPLTLQWQISGPVNSSGSEVINAGTLAVGNILEVGIDGMDLSIAGSYTLSAYIEPNAVNLLAINDSLLNIQVLTIDPYVFDAIPDNAFITTPVDTVELTVNSNMFPAGGFLLTEICHFKYSVGAPVGGWPAYLLADDYVEITGAPNSDLAGFTLEQWNASTMVSSHAFAPGTVLSPSGTAIIAVGQMGASVSSPANFYYHGNGAYTGSFSSSDATGRILKDPSNIIIDAVGYNTYTFPIASGVTPADWSGNTGNPGSTSGTRLIGPDDNTATNWAVSSATYPQDPNMLNPNVSLPTNDTLTDFSWSLGGIITSVNNPDTVVGPWLVNGLYQYVATYTTTCGVFTDTVHITVFIPQFDLTLNQIIEPVGSNCYFIDEQVTIEIGNLGTDTVPAGFTASYSVDGGAPVSEVVGQDVPPGESIVYNFTTPLIITFAGQDTTVYIEIWVNFVSDPFQFNDTLGGNYTFLYTPDPPIGNNDTINYGTQATLTAVSPNLLYWYDQSVGGNELESGTTYLTPVLYASTPYYVGASTILPGGITQIGTGTQTSYSVPVSGWDEYCWSTSLYLASELNFSGAIDTIAYYVSNSFGASPIVSQNIYMQHVAYNTFASADYVGTTGLTQVYSGTITWSGPGWIKIPLTTPFNYDGTNNLIIHWEDHSGTYPANSPYFNSTTVPSNMVKYNYDWMSFPNWAGYFQTIRPNTTFYHETMGCESDRTEVWAIVEPTSIPTADVGVIAITTPNSGIDLGTQTVTVRVKNFGTDPQTNIPVSYSVNGGAAVNETIVGTILSGDTVTYQFTTPFNFIAYGAYIFKSYTSLGADIITVNDTTQKTVNNNPLIYCDSYATSNGYGDIGNVTISNLNNGNPLPVTSNSSANNTYSNFTTTLPPVELAAGASYPISVSGIWPGSFYTSYVKVFIDYNIDGVFDPVTELVFGGLMNSVATATITGNVTVPLTATSGYTRMRVVMVETSSAASVQPCGTYTWGETEDYTVVIAPLIPQDGGVFAINAPLGIYSEGEQVDVIVTVRNFGTDPLTSIPLSYQHNANPPVSDTWTGNLAPGATVQVQLPPLTVENGVNNLCAETAVVGDANTFNDKKCDSFWGLPGLIMYEDDFEGSSGFTTTGNVWEHGIPTATIINHAFDGDSCWVTKLAGVYPANATEYLVSPTFNFSGVYDAYLSIAYWMFAEENFDGGNVQYSTNNGFSWTTLGTIADPTGYNWYDTYVYAQPSWSVNTGGWKSAFISLAALNNAGSSVKFRFVFRSNATNQSEGFAVDAVKIHVPPIALDAGIAEIESPVGQSITGGANQVTVKLKNYGTTPLTSIPLSYRISTGPPPVNATWTGNLAPGAETSYTFSAPYTGPFAPYTLCAYTVLTGDIYKFNDTVCYAMTPGQAAIDGGISAVTAPNMVAPAGQTQYVSATITNFGTDPLSNFPVQYFLNGTIQTTEYISATLSPGASMSYTFITPFNSTGTDYQLCAKTAIPSDANPTNDQTCIDLFVSAEEFDKDVFMLYQNIPNPASDETQISFVIPASGTVEFTLTDILGKEVIVKYSDYHAGKNSIILNTSSLAAGIYYYSVMFDNQRLTRKLSIVR